MNVPLEHTTVIPAMGGASTGQVALAVLATLVIAWWELDAWVSD